MQHPVCKSPLTQGNGMERRILACVHRYVCGIRRVHMVGRDHADGIRNNRLAMPIPYSRRWFPPLPVLLWFS